jgi:hypothetical protein
MEQHETLNCPLCQGRGNVRRSNLIAALGNNELRQKIEKYAAELLGGQNELTSVGANGSRDFQTEVHSWNPQLPIWRRSPKE